VGTRIAVLADPDDDIKTLEIPPEDTKAAPKSQKPAEPPTSGSAAPQPASEPSSRASSDTPKKSGGKATKQTYPLYPSVLSLLKENGLSASDADNIPASGPNGRLLKGDVLAYLGKIESDYSAEQSKRISKLGHLDLSNIKLAKPTEAVKKPETPTAAAPTPAEIETDTELALPIKLDAVLECQKRIQDTLKIHLPVSTFIARAIELANEDLPKSKKAPSTEELFDAVLGLDKVFPPPDTSRGTFIPDITPLAPSLQMPVRQNITKRKAKEVDIIDLLAGTAKARKTTLAIPSSARPVAGTVNVFSVMTPKGDEKRAMVFLERMKSVLEVEPGRLVM
jgi:hypothetical protein